MDIRESRETDLNCVVDLWYKGSIEAHDFIDRNYWKSEKENMKSIYLPMAQTYVISNEGKIVGFVSMVDTYLAALFIDSNDQGKGYGKALLNYVKRKHPLIHLKVYKQNTYAIRFYKRNGFIIKEHQIDEQTTEEEFVMEWKSVDKNN